MKVMDDNNSSTENTSTLPPIPTPQTVSELENLIRQFYGLNTPQQYTQIDTCLKSVQKDHGAFALADQLMNSTDTNVRFFGALTFTVKINRDWIHLNPNESKDLLDRLLYWFINRVNAKDVSIVIRKLCTALTTVFRQTTGDWTLCMQHIVTCIAAGQVVGYEQLSDRSNIQSDVQSLSPFQSTACLWFGSALIEEVSKVDTNTPQGDKTFKSACLNVPSLLDIIEYCLTSDTTQDHSLAQDAIKLLHTLRGSNQDFTSDEQTKSRMSNLILDVVSTISPNDLWPTIADLATDLVGRDFGQPLARIVTTKLVEPSFDDFLQELQDGDFNDENLIYGRLLITTATTYLDDLLKTDSGREAVLERMILLCNCQGYPIEDDTLIPEVLEFWSGYAECAIDVTAVSNKEHPRDPALITQISNRIRRVLEALLKRMQLPPTDIFSRWDRQAQAEFRAMRRDFRDFSASAFNLLGIGMFQTLVTFLLRLWTEQDWPGAEVVLQCLKGVIECVVDTSTADSTLMVLLNSPIYQPNDTKIPQVIQQATIEIVADCSPFFEGQSEAPSKVLQWLFDCLRNPVLSLSASKAISAICDACRSSLATNAVELAQLYTSFHDMAKSSTSTEQSIEVLERLAGAIGAVIQALWAKTKSSPLRASATDALDIMLTTVMDTLTTSEQDDTPQGKDSRLTALQSLANIARAFREVDGDFVDLDGGSPSNGEVDHTSQQWSKQRQHAFFEILSRILDRYPQDGDLMEAVCLLIRAGTTDDLDNPFKITPEVLVCLGRYLKVTQRPGFLLETISRWLRSSRKGSTIATGEPNQVNDSIRSREHVARCYLSTTLPLLRELHETTGKMNHTELMSSILEFVSTYIPHDLDLFFIPSLSEDLKFAMAIAVQSFSESDPLMKQAASGSWIKLLDIRPPPGEINQSATFIHELIVSNFADLTAALLLGISGAAIRSELDAFILPFRRLIVFPLPRTQGQPKLRDLFEMILCGPTFPSSRVSDTDKKRFIEKVIRLRGESSGTAKVCKEWWVTCRGTFS